MFASKELSSLLGTSVSIKEIKPELFNKIALKEVLIKDQNNLTILNANKIAANYNLLELLDRRLIINTVQLFSFDGHIYKDSLNGPTNIDFIIQQLNPKHKREKKGLLEIQLRTILVRRGNITYDVLSEPSSPGKFTPHHINISNLLASVSIKSISKDTVNAVVKRMSFNEESGFELRKLSFAVKGNKERIDIPKLQINLPSSSLNINDLHVDMSSDSILKNRKSLFKFDKLARKSFLTKAKLNLLIKSSFINTADVHYFLPILREFPTTISVDTKVAGTVDNLKVDELTINARELLFINAQASSSGLYSSDDPYFFADIKEIYSTPEFSELIFQHLLPKDHPYRTLGEKLGFVRANLSIMGFKSDLIGNLKLKSDLAEIDLQTNIRENKQKEAWDISGQLNTSKVKVSSIVKGKSNALFGEANSWLDYTAEYKKGETPQFIINGELFDFDFKGYRYNNLKLGAKYDHNSFTAGLYLNDLNGFILGKIDLKDINSKQMKLTTNIELNGVNTDALLLTGMKKNTSFSGKLISEISGNSPDNMSGFVQLDSVQIENNSDTVFVDCVKIQADQKDKYKQIRISSPLISGDIRGEYALSTLPKELIRILTKELPALFPNRKSVTTNQKNHVIYGFQTGNINPLFRVFSINLDIPKPVSLNGFMDNQSDEFNLSLIAPRIKAGKSLIDQGQIYIHSEGEKQIVELRATTYNKKRTPTSLNIHVTALSDSILTKIQAYNAGQKTFGGEMDFLTTLRRDENKKISGLMELRPTNLVLNDTTWNIAPAVIKLQNNRVSVENFIVSHQDQHVKIQGVASKEKNDSLCLKLNSINLDYVFELINVPNVQFGGYASGDFTLSDFEKIPHISTENFNVKNFSYNNAYLGDLKLHSSWDQSNSGILMKGNIKENENTTFVDGYIFPTRDSLDLSFNAEHLNIGFINQFVSTIFSKFEGKATGEVRLFGRFSKLALNGSAQLENIKLGVGYTNTEYTINDKVYLEPERIYFENVSLMDIKGNTGKASGEMRHSGFKQIKYDISLFPEKMLVFDTNSKINSLFFGTIFATGKGTIRGDDTNVYISMNGKSESNSTFTFSLSNSATANEYRFLTFVNKSNAEKSNTSIPNDTDIEPEVKTTNINIDLQMDVTPDAKLTLIMDETTGDEIQTTGSGSLRLNFDTKNDDVKLYGAYTIEKGNYFFNLQNLFVREFQIENGSSVTFRGDPMAAELKMNAIYALTANLHDLDESFSTDKDLSRTNVPVQCLLNITGDMLQPDLNFDIWLPSNSDDINRKVKSIIGTPEMMNQQIIYLLLLNKFYTPDYLNVGQRNELSAIASSTISSQLNNILRQVSSNWNLGTNIRSDKGDFSDIEVELALSSQLLNNRLLINGNFGYKDNPKSQTNFIGDIDAEYKLSKTGNLRLKGYNKTNDRYYYIKSAVTTQGLGLIYKRDFDKLVDLIRLRKFKSKKKEKSLEKEQTSLED